MASKLQDPRTDVAICYLFGQLTDLAFPPNRQQVVCSSCLSRSLVNGSFTDWSHSTVDGMFAVLVHFKGSRSAQWDLFHCQSSLPTFHFPSDFAHGEPRQSTFLQNSIPFNAYISVQWTERAGLSIPLQTCVRVARMSSDASRDMDYLQIFKIPSENAGIWPWLLPYKVIPIRSLPSCHPDILSFDTTLSRHRNSR